MRNRVVSVLFALVLVSSVAVLAIPVTADQPDAAIESVNTSIDQPAPGESFTLTANLANRQSSSSPIEVSDVYVRKSGSASDFARIENVGTISPGGSLAIPLTMNLTEPGEQQLTVHAVVRDADGDTRRISHPLYVNVAEPNEVALSFEELDPIAGEESAFNVSVANGDSSPLSNVQVDLEGDGDIQNPNRVSASIDAGADRTHSYQVTFPEAGAQTLNATVTYTTNQGTTRTVSQETTVDVDEANVDPGLTAAAQVENGSSVIRASLTEYGNAELRDVQVRAVVENETVARAVAPDVPEQSTRSVSIDGSDVPAGTVAVVAEYTAAGEAQSTTTTIDYSPEASSAITLTGVETSRQGSTLTLSGDAANIGGADANSVLVSVVETDDVTPVSPNREYFVGGIETSEFATFDLTANASSDIDAVPVQINYTVDGERHSTVTSVDVRGNSVQAGENESQPGGPGQGGPPLTAVGIVALLLVGGGVIYRWRK